MPHDENTNSYYIDECCKQLWLENAAQDNHFWHRERIDSPEICVNSPRKLGLCERFCIAS